MYVLVGNGRGQLFKRVILISTLDQLGPLLLHVGHGLNDVLTGELDPLVLIWFDVVFDRYALLLPFWGGLEIPHLDALQVSELLFKL